MNFKVLNNLIFIIYLNELCSNQNGKVQKETLADSNLGAVKTTLRPYVISKWPFLFFKFFKNFSSFLCHLVKYNREYYEWLCRLKYHIQVGRLLVQGTWLGLVNLSVIRESVWPTGWTSNNLVINIRWWRCPLPSGPSLALSHPNSWLETHFVLLAKIIEYAIFQLNLSHRLVLIETV